MNQFEDALDEPLLVKKDEDKASLVDTASNTSDAPTQSVVQQLRSRREGDWSRTFFLVALLGMSMIYPWLCFKFRSADWVKTYLTTTTLVVADDLDIGSNTSLVYETDFEGVRHWYRECDANAVYVQCFLFLFNVFPLLKIASCFITMFVVGYGPSDLRLSISSVVVIRPRSLNNISYRHSSAQVEEKNIVERIIAGGYNLFDSINVFFAMGTMVKLTSVPLYMQIILLIASSPTFMTQGYEYSFATSLQEGPYIFYICTIITILISDINRVQHFRWKRRILVAQRNTADDSVSDVDVETTSNIEDQEGNIEAESTPTSRYNIIQKYRDLSDTKKASYHLAIAMLTRLFLIFLPVIKLEYSGESAKYLDETSHKLTIYDLVFEFQDKAFQGKDSFWISVILVFDIILMPIFLLLLTLLLKVVRHHDVKSSWIPPMFYSLTYFQVFGNLEGLMLATIFSVGTLEYIMRVLVDYGGDTCHSDETDSYCYVVKPYFQVGTWILLIHCLSFSLAVNRTQADLDKKLPEMLAEDAYGPDVLTSDEGSHHNQEEEEGRLP